MHYRLFHRFVARPTAISGQGKDLLRHLGLDSEDIEYSYREAVPYNEESAIMNGLYRWMRGMADRPPAWAALLEAMHVVGIEEDVIMDLEKELLEGTVCMLSG